MGGTAWGGGWDFCTEPKFDISDGHSVGNRGRQLIVSLEYQGSG